MITFSLFFLSRFPVGSSAKIILGVFAIARKIATLCFSPPDNSLGLLSILLDNPIFDKRFNAFFFADLYVEPLIN